MLTAFRGIGTAHWTDWDSSLDGLGQLTGRSVTAHWTDWDSSLDGLGQLTELF